jgi:hypothetical protein
MAGFTSSSAGEGSTRAETVSAAKWVSVDRRRSRTSPCTTGSPPPGSTSPEDDPDLGGRTPSLTTVPPKSSDASSARNEIARGRAGLSACYANRAPCPTLGYVGRRGCGSLPAGLSRLRQRPDEAIPWASAGRRRPPRDNGRNLAANRQVGGCPKQEHARHSDRDGCRQAGGSGCARPTDWRPAQPAASREAPKTADQQPGGSEPRVAPADRRSSVTTLSEQRAPQVAAPDLQERQVLHRRLVQSGDFAG